MVRFSDSQITVSEGVYVVWNFSLRTRVEDDHVLVSVGDDGPGVPPELRSRIFEPFFTTKPVGAGTGLGLDISYRVVTGKHGGDIQVISQPGDTRFEVRLPLVEPTLQDAVTGTE